MSHVPHCLVCSVLLVIFAMRIGNGLAYKAASVNDFSCKLLKIIL